MEKTKGLLNAIKQHDKLAITVNSNGDHNLSAGLVEKFLQPHRIDYYFFAFVDKGSTTYKVDVKEYTISNGQLLFLLPNQIYTPPTKKSDEYFKMGFDANTLALLPQQFPFLVNPLNKNVITFGSESRERVRTFFRIVNKLLHSNNNSPDTNLILAHLNTLLTEINSAYFKGSNQGSITNLELSTYIEFKLAVETHLTEHQSVRSIAEQLAVNTSSLYSIVKAFAGVSPKEFITNRLMVEAQRKLYYSNLSVKELAYELGFNDPGYFSRLFKKSTGKNVTEFLEEL